MLVFRCPICKRKKTAPEEHGGKKAKCSCGAILLIPGSPAPEPSAPTGSDLAEPPALAPTDSDLVEPPASAKVVVWTELPVASPIANSELTPEQARGVPIAPISDAVEPTDRQPAPDDPPAEEYLPRDRKYCLECGKIIRSNAEICPKCGVRQPDRYREPVRYREDDWDRPRKSRNGVKVPILISAISNIVVGLLWAGVFLPCFGLIFTIPMFILCIFEFVLWSQADSLSGRKLGGKACTLGIFELIVGLANLPTMICGIIVLINSGKVADTR